MIEKISAEKAREMYGDGIFHIDDIHYATDTYYKAIKKLKKSKKHNTLGNINKFKHFIRKG